MVYANSNVHIYALRNAEYECKSNRDTDDHSGLRACSLNWCVRFGFAEVAREDVSEHRKWKLTI